MRPPPPKREVYHVGATPLDWLVVLAVAAIQGCATSQYAVRPTPAPEESASALRIERAISAHQARQQAARGARRVGADERVQGFAVQAIVDRLSRVTERPYLHYRAYLVDDQDPNASALADGRLYLTTGLLDYLASRGDRVDELAFVLAHELAHTVAQHLVKRYRTVQQQSLFMTVLAAGVSAATRNTSPAGSQTRQLALDVASLLNNIAISGYSQDQELEADQLGIRYVIRAGFDPHAALDLLQDFSRFETSWSILRTHPYAIQRRQFLSRYLAQVRRVGGPQPAHSHPDHEGAPASASRDPDTSQVGSALEQRRRRLREAQRLYPKGSLSWTNLQRQLDELDDPL